MATVKTFGKYTLFWNVNKAKSGSWETTNSNGSRHEHIFSIFWISNYKYPHSGRVLSIIIGKYNLFIAIKK